MPMASGSGVFSRTTGGPPLRRAGSNVFGYSQEGGRKQVVYVADDNGVHELSVGVGEQWRSTNLMLDSRRTASPAPPVSYPTISAYEWSHSQQVTYLSRDGHVHELYRIAGGEWLHADLAFRRAVGKRRSGPRFQRMDGGLEGPNKLPMSATTDTYTNCT